MFSWTTTRRILLQARTSNSVPCDLQIDLLIYKPWICPGVLGCFFSGKCARTSFYLIHVRRCSRFPLASTQPSTKTEAAGEDGHVGGEEEEAEVVDACVESRQGRLWSSIEWESCLMLCIFILTLERISPVSSPFVCHFTPLTLHRCQYSITLKLV